MSFEEGDKVIFRDEHHEKNGEEGEIVQVSETMFGDESYTVEVEGETIGGLGEDQLEAVEE
ncbi:MAG: DUF1918 domain-containing protein [Halobacteriales archaeon]|nr:DUF1918 domain-containing protein [Halobacteriales archaeon]